MPQPCYKISDQELATIAEQIKQLDAAEAKGSQAALQAATDKGGLLLQVKQALGHGPFMAWVEANMSFTHTTANKYMALHERREQVKLKPCCNLADAYRLLFPPKRPTKKGKKNTGTKLTLHFTAAETKEVNKILAKLVEAVGENTTEQIFLAALRLYKEKVDGSHDAPDQQVA